MSAALETVLYSQMLVLFAPQAVPAKSHLPVLVGWVREGCQVQCGLLCRLWPAQASTHWLLPLHV